MKKSELKTVGNPEQKLKEIVNKMAIYFNKNISNADLVQWMSSATGWLIDDNQLVDSAGKPTESFEFICAISYTGLLPDLVKCTTNQERLDTLIISLPGYFTNSSYKELKKGIGEIGICFLKYEYQNQYSIDVLNTYLNIYTTFLNLIEMYHDYDKCYEEFRKAA